MEKHLWRYKLAADKWGKPLWTRSSSFSLEADEQLLTFNPPPPPHTHSRFKSFTCGCLAAGWVGFPPSCSQQPRALAERGNCSPTGNQTAPKKRAHPWMPKFAVPHVCMLWTCAQIYSYIVYIADLCRTSKLHSYIWQDIFFAFTNTSTASVTCNITDLVSVSATIQSVLNSNLRINSDLSGKQKHSIFLWQAAAVNPWSCHEHMDTGGGCMTTGGWA